ncbi:MAG: hypothetical protein PUE01_03115 [Clostridiaceae bacterium]|nr:hypothetical protein [Clostridiaceae bacterium]
MFDNSKGMEKFIEEYFDGSRKNCALTLEISQSTLCRVINGSSIGGRKFLGKIINYCDMNNIDYKEFIRI